MNVNSLVPAELQTTIGDTYNVEPNYNKISENIRRFTPHSFQCSVFCGGSNCKYESDEFWSSSNMAIKGVYSHWVTDDILAMARPNTAMIIKKNMIDQFHSCGIKSILNLQSSREHASCGTPLEESGFSYDPNLFMGNQIFYYNFAWKDYGEATIQNLLDMVKVLAFAVSEGRVAVHCHAGLGRTGVLIACYLVYALRVRASDAIRFVRLKRPGSVQTRGQIFCVRQFAQFILPQTLVYCIRDQQNSEKKLFSLGRYLKRQLVTLHGYEERTYKYLPKIVHQICERLIKLSGCCTDDYAVSNVPFTKYFLTSKLFSKIIRDQSSSSIYSSSSDTLFTPSLTPINLLPSCQSSDALHRHTENNIRSESIIKVVDRENLSKYSISCASGCSDLSMIGDDIGEENLTENKCFQEIVTQQSFSKSLQLDISQIYTTDEVVSALLMDHSSLTSDIKNEIKQFQIDFNCRQLTWTRVNAETNLSILTALLYDWIECLKTPILDKDHLQNVVIFFKQPENCFQRFKIENQYLIEYLLRFISRLQPPYSQQNELLRRLISSFTQQSVIVNNTLLPNGKGFRRMREGTLRCTVELIQALYALFEESRQQSARSSESHCTGSESLEVHSFSDDDSDVECEMQY